MLKRQLILVATSGVLVSTLPSLPALADDNAAKPAGKDGSASLDSMWIDQEAPTIDKDLDTKGKAGTVASVGGMPSLVAPMCAFTEFRNSNFVTKSSWPGIGPFKSSSSDISDLSDEKHNHLKVSVKNEQITGAQLGLGKLGSGNVRDFLDIEMGCDFLLESLGAKPRKIAEFNKQLEKSKTALKPGAASISLAAGRYQITLDRSASARPYSCLIAINSLDANKTVLAEHSSPPPADEPADLGSIVSVGEAKTPQKKPGDLFNKIKKPPAKGQPPSPTVDTKREEFVTAIKTWQTVKKTALKTRDAGRLSDILSGNALNKQTTAVKWLQTHGNFYDMDPRGCVVDKYTDLGGGKKYSVIAQVREFSKYIKEDGNVVLKEVDDKYVVNYTIEKINDKWMITDSLVVNNTQPGRPASASTKH